MAIKTRKPPVAAKPPVHARPAAAHPVAHKPHVEPQPPQDGELAKVTGGKASPESEHAAKAEHEASMHDHMASTKNAEAAKGAGAPEPRDTMSKIPEAASYSQAAREHGNARHDRQVEEYAIKTGQFGETRAAHEVPASEDEDANLQMVSDPAKVDSIKVGDKFFAAFIHRPIDDSGNITDDQRHANAQHADLVSGRMQRRGLSTEYWKSRAAKHPPRAVRTDKGYSLID